MLPYILMPLVVATPFTEQEKLGMDPTLWMQAENTKKKSEPEPDIAKMLLECIILLCQRRGIREELRRRKVYPICRNLDYSQEDEAVSATILEIVNLLMGEEDPTTLVDQPAPATLRGGESFLPFAGAAGGGGNNVDGRGGSEKCNDAAVSSSSSSLSSSSSSSSELETVD